MVFPDGLCRWIFNSLIVSYHSFWPDAEAAVTDRPFAKVLVYEQACEWILHGSLHADRPLDELISYNMSYNIFTAIVNESLSEKKSFEAGLIA